MLMPNGAARILFFCLYKKSQRARVRSPSLGRNRYVGSVGFLSLVIWYIDIRGGAENSCQVELEILTRGMLHQTAPEYDWAQGRSLAPQLGLVSSASAGFVLGRITAPVDGVTYPLSLDCCSQGHHLAR